MKSQLEIALRLQVRQMLDKADDRHDDARSLTEQSMRDRAFGWTEGMQSAAAQLEQFCNELFD